MSIDEKRIPEILFAVILIVVLLIAILLVTNPLAGKTVSTTNSQNTNSYNTYTSNYNYYEKNYYPTRDSDYIKIYDSCGSDEYLDCKSHSEIKRVEGIFGNSIDKYIVYVKNTEYKGGYFKVNFYFTDYYGDEKVETITKYIPARGEEIFYYKDIYADRLTNYKWSYKVTSYTKI